MNIISCVLYFCQVVCGIFFLLSKKQDQFSNQWGLFYSVLFIGSITVAALVWFLNDLHYKKFLKIIISKNYQKLLGKPSSYLISRFGMNIHRFPNYETSLLLEALTSISDDVALQDFAYQISNLCNFYYDQDMYNDAAKKRRKTMISRVRYECFLLTSNINSDAVLEEIHRDVQLYNLVLQDFWKEILTGRLHDLWMFAGVAYNYYMIVKSFYRTIYSVPDKQSFFISKINLNNVTCHEILERNIYKPNHPRHEEDRHIPLKNLTKRQLILAEIFISPVFVLFVTFILFIISSFYIYKIAYSYKPTFEFFYDTGRLSSALFSNLLLSRFKAIDKSHYYSTEDLTKNMEECILFPTKIGNITQDYIQTVMLFRNFQNMFWNSIKNFPFHNCTDILEEYELSLFVVDGSFSKTKVPLFFAYTPGIMNEFFYGEQIYGDEWYGSATQIGLQRPVDEFFVLLNNVLDDSYESVMSYLPDSNDRKLKRITIGVYCTLIFVVIQPICVYYILKRLEKDFFKPFLLLSNHRVMEILSYLSAETLSVESEFMSRLHMQRKQQKNINKGKVFVSFNFPLLLMVIILQISFTYIKNLQTRVKTNFNILYWTVKTESAALRMGGIVSNIMVQVLKGLEFEEDVNREQRVRELDYAARLLLNASDFFIEVTYRDDSPFYQASAETGFSFTNMLTIIGHDTKRFMRLYLLNQTFENESFISFMENFFWLTTHMYNMMDEVIDTNKYRRRLMLDCISVSGSLLIVLSFGCIATYLRFRMLFPDNKKIIDAIGPSMPEGIECSILQIDEENQRSRKEAVEQYFMSEDIISYFQTPLLLTDKNNTVRIESNSAKIFNNEETLRTFQEYVNLSGTNKFGVFEFFMGERVIRGRFLNSKGILYALDDITDLNTEVQKLYSKTNHIRMLVTQIMPASFAERELSGQLPEFTQVMQASIATVLITGYNSLTLEEIEFVKRKINETIRSINCEYVGISNQLFSVLIHDDDKVKSTRQSLYFCVSLLSQIHDLKSKGLRVYCVIDCMSTFFENTLHDTPFFIVYSSSIMASLRNVSRATPWKVILTKEACEVLYNTGLKLVFSSKTTMDDALYFLDE